MANQFTNTPATFSFNETSDFTYVSSNETYLTGLTVVGDTTKTYTKDLPMGEECTVGGTAGNACQAWASNGTATFGGEYASGLVEGHVYHFKVDYYDIKDVEQTGTQNSGKFSMVYTPKSTTSSSSSSTSTSSSTTSSSSATTTATTSPTSTPTSAPSTSHFSTGAKIGAAVGAGCVALLIMSAIIYFWRKSRHVYHPVVAAGAAAYNPYNNEQSSNPRQLYAKMPEPSISVPLYDMENRPYH